MADDGFAAFAAENVQVFDGHFGDEAAGFGEVVGALAFAFDAVGEGKVVFGAGDANVHEAAFFFKAAFFDAVAVGKQAFFAAN